MNITPKVSIVIATYRRDKDLKNALDSIAKLTYETYEIILVDDNDDAFWNDKVKQIVMKFKMNNPSIEFSYVQNHPNMGSANTRNIGIVAASGEYICFLDDDDIYMPDRIQNQLIPMMESNADYSITDLALYSENEKLIEIRKRTYIQDTSKESLLKYHMMYHMTGTDTLMFKREYLTKIGGFDPIDVGDEFYLMSKAIEHDGKFLYVPTCDVKAYVHTGEGGLSSGAGKIDGENRLFEHKRRFFANFDKEVIKYIQVRHYMVLAFAYLRNKQYALFIKESVIAVCIDVKSFISIINNRK